VCSGTDGAPAAGAPAFQERKSIPGFPEFAGLELNHRAEVEAHLGQWPPATSELTFTNLFMWADTYHPTVCILNGALCCLLQPDYRSAFFLPPVGGHDLPGICGQLLRWLEERSEVPTIERAPASLVSVLVGPGRPFLADEDPDQADYVYRSRDLIHLPGNRYHPKRNNIRKFEREHPWEYRPLSEDLLPQCRDLQEHWCDLRGCDAGGPAMAGEHLAVMRLLDHYHELGVCGGAVLVEGRVAAFAIGERLNPDTAVIHVEKGDPNLPGVYQVINREFAREWSHLAFINREQDLGDPGLRQAKQSYYPDHMIAKYVVRSA